ncbi:MAG: PIN domain-containing protein [Candidatus Electrothrix sp. YB6]
MQGIDTNILVRFLIGDDDLQTKTVYNIFKQAEADKNELFIPLLVILELIWVLESVYEISRKDIINSISDLLLMPVLRFEQQSTVQRFTREAYGNTYDLSDLLIACSAGQQGCDTVITFDKKASRCDLFHLAQ